MFYLRHSAGLQGYFTNTNSSALSREIYFYCSIFRVRRYCPVLMILRTQACNVTLNPALVFYLGILSVDAAIHALIFRQVNRILNLIQAQVPLRTHTKSSYRFLSWQTAC